MGIKAIETRYKGYRFRSRLEARYAVFLDAMNIPWEYEHEGYDLGSLGYYLPDFWLPAWGVHAEVKPQTFSPEEFAKAAAVPGGSLLLDGSPETRHYFYTSCPRDDADNPWDMYQSIRREGWGTVNLEWSLCEGRLFYDFGEGLKAYQMDVQPRAVEIAMSARFEHGETPQ